MDLNERQEQFCLEYVKDLNATQAAIRAGYSERGAAVQGARLLTNVKIARRVDELKANRREKVKVDAEWLLRRLAEEAEADVNDLFDEDDGRLKPVKDWPLIWRQGLVAGIDVQQLFEGRGEDREHIGNIVKVKLADRGQRLKMLGDHIGVQAFRENLNVSGSIDLVAKIREGRERARLVGSNMEEKE